mmetsp:Transcript_11460/g.24096  ORF Transcript_11460/g.24096 Transcript_11460/m.24096 type:complete len:521 (+) Transcript_11460:69-1631(+)
MDKLTTTMLPTKAAFTTLLILLQTLAPIFSVEIQVASSLSQFPYDENSHLSSHLYLFPGSGPCQSTIQERLSSLSPEALYGHVPIAVVGEAAETFFHDRPIPQDGSSPTYEDCPAVCIDRGIDASLVAHPMSYKYYDSSNPDHAGNNFLGSLSCGRVEFGFINYYHKPLSLQWVDPISGRRQHLYLLERLERNTKFIHTYVGHRFVAVDTENDDEVILDHVVEFNGIIGIKNHVNPHEKRDIKKAVQNTMGGEWRKHLAVTRTFSALGFDKGRLPDDIFGSMRAFYYNNRNPPHRLLEEWDSKGVYVNYWETDCNFMQIPWHLKHKWQGRLKDLVEAWAGVPLEQTDLYGVRQYEAGARLLTHVDRISTHAASLIVNIAQGNLTRPWTVEVYDHADRLHEVAMEPGDIVYYESAKALHGRNTPLAGGYYANLFTHYRPVDDPMWYKKENPEGTPEPLIDVGKCELVGKPDEYSVGAVKCENDAIGPHLSPTMFQARSGEDLYQWWLKVGGMDDGETIDEL